MVVSVKNETNMEPFISPQKYNVKFKTFLKIQTIFSKCFKLLFKSGFVLPTIVQTVLLIYVFVMTF